jgi:hypothetical protein
MKSGNLNFLEPSGPLQACNGTALPLPLTLPLPLPLPISGLPVGLKKKRHVQIHFPIPIKDKVHPTSGHQIPEGGVNLYLYSFFNLGAKWMSVVNTTPRPLYHHERYPLPIVQEAGWAPRKF